MKKFLYWTTITAIGTLLIYTAELIVLLSLHPARYYFTLKGFGLVSLIETGIVAVSLPYMMWYYRNYFGPFLNGEFKTDKERA